MALGVLAQSEELDLKLGGFGGILLPQPEAAGAAACGAISKDNKEGSVVLVACVPLAGVSSCPCSSVVSAGECGNCDIDDGGPFDDDGGFPPVPADIQSWPKERQLAWMEEDFARLRRG